MALAFAAAACGERLPISVQTIDRPELILDAGDSPPPDSRPGWHAQPLPDLWGVARRRVATAGWYRADFDLPAAAAEPWAIYLPRPGMNVAVFLDGTAVGDGGRLDEPLARNWNRPLLFPVPATLLGAGRHRLDVNLRTSAVSPVLLAPIHLGPLRVLRPVYERRHLLQVTFAQVVTILMAVIGVLIAIVYLPRDERRDYRWFVAGILLWAWSMTDYFVREAPMSVRLWSWSTGTALNAAVPCFILAFHRRLGYRRPRLERLLALSTVLGSGALLAVPALYLFSAFTAWLCITVAWGAYLLTLMIAASRQVERRSLWLLVPGLCAMGFGVHDLSAIAAGRDPTPLLWPYAMPVVILVAGGLMLAHLADGLQEAEDLNRDLERRVEEKHTELERNYHRLHQLERAQAVAHERDRIMRDMHDGMGGQLVSTLALVESGRATPTAIADALASALDDLRLVIDSLDPVEEDLLAVLATVRARLEPRLTRNGVRFDWQVTDLPPIPGFGPERVLQALRILQEAITNVVKHAGASVVRVRTAVTPGPGGRPGVCVEVGDDGGGMRGNGTGRGIANMRRRAAALGGELEIASADTGTTVRLWLPLDGSATPRS